MSHAAVSWAWKQDLPCAQRMVLMVLADYYHPAQDSTVFPSQSHVAERAGLSRKHVNTVLGELEAAGLISIVERARENGGNTSCEYIVHAPEEKQVNRPTPEPVGVVYVVTCGTRTKIGIARDIDKRLASLQTSNPDPVELIRTFPGPMKLVRQWEKQAHEELKDHRISGEWFELTALEVVAVVEPITQVVEGGMSPEVTGGQEPEVTAPVTTGDTINLHFNPDKKDRSRSGSIPASPVVSLHTDDPVFREIVRRQGGREPPVGRSGYWSFPAELVEQAKQKLAA
jgi:hypothetical protein